MAVPREQERWCVVIPACGEAARIHWVVKGVLKHCPDVIVVDDGSRDDTAVQAERAGARVLRHASNLGKGSALNTGFQYAREHGFDFVITMDGDGQHAAEDIPRFVEAYVRTGIPVLLGNRMPEARSIPIVRRWTNYFLTWLLNAKMRWYVPDSQCGFRLYRCDVIPFIAAESRSRAADSEILLHVAGRGIRMDTVPVQVIYGTERRRLNPLFDAWEFHRMLRRYRRAYGRAAAGRWRGAGFT